MNNAYAPTQYMEYLANANIASIYFLNISGLTANTVIMDAHCMEYLENTI